jgi:hypothetical protein
MKTINCYALYDFNNQIITPYCVVKLPCDTMAVVVQLWESGLLQVAIGGRAREIEVYAAVDCKRII